MKLLLQITMAAAVAASAMAITSCGRGCCTGEAPVPGLRPLPTFEQPAPVVEYAK